MRRKKTKPQLGPGFELNLEHLEHIEQLLNHLEIWRFHEAFNHDTRMQDYVEQSELLLDEVRPGRVLVFDVLMSSVRSFLEDLEEDLQDQV